MKIDKILHYLGIAALGFLALVTIGITLGASTMLACYLTTATIDHASQKFHERQQIDAPRAPSGGDLLPYPDESQGAERDRREGRRTWAYDPTDGFTKI